MPDRAAPVSGLWAARYGTPEESDDELTPRSPVRRLLAALCWAQVAVIVGWGIYYVYEILQGLGDDRTRAWMSVVLMLFLGAGLAGLAYGWRRGHQWPAMPTLLWHGLLIPVAWSLIQAGQWLWALVVVGLIVAAVIAMVNVAMYEARAED